MTIKPKQKQWQENKTSDIKNTSGNIKAPLVVKSNKKTKEITKKPSKAKYDWKALKQDFLESTFLEVAPFIRHRLSKDEANDWNTLKQTTWWADEKKKIREEIKQKALEDFKTNLSKEWQDTFLKLEQAHLRWLNDLVEMLLKQWEIDRKIVEMRIRDEDTWEIKEIKNVEDVIYRPRLNQWEVINILKHIKLEKWEPTDIVENWSKAKAWLLEMKQKKQHEKSK